MTATPAWPPKSAPRLFVAQELAAGDAVMRWCMNLFRFAFPAILAAFPVAANAAPALQRDTVATIASALQDCTGGLRWSASSAAKLKTDWAARLDLLVRPSNALTYDEARDLYEVGKSLLAVPSEATRWMADYSASLECPAHPVEAVTLFEYLTGELPADLRGPANSFQWLGLAYERGATGKPDPIRARRLYLRSKLHGVYFREDRWADEVDADLLGNAERAGMRHYFDALAIDEERGATVRMILAEQVLAADPAKARRLLRNIDGRSLVRLLELEESGRVPFVADANDITHWAKATRVLFGFNRWAARMLKGVRQANGDDIPTAVQRPAIAQLRPHLDLARVQDALAAQSPIPVRALVDPIGRPIYVEACMPSIPTYAVLVDGRGLLLDAARLYNAANPELLPNLPITRVRGRAVYGWVLLPQVHFKRSALGELQTEFVPADPKQCVFSAVVDMPPLPVAPSAPSVGKSL